MTHKRTPEFIRPFYGRAEILILLLQNRRNSAQTRIAMTAHTNGPHRPADRRRDLLDRDELFSAARCVAPSIA